LSSHLLSKILKIACGFVWCETLPLTLREEHRARVFENTVLRRIFGPNRDELVAWRKLHNEMLHNITAPRLYVVDNYIFHWN
jgi:hypothetical protein